MYTAQMADAYLRNALPADSELFSLQFVSADERYGSLAATLRTVTWELAPDGQSRTVHSMKEQPVFLVNQLAARSPDRVRAYLRGWCAALYATFTLLDPAIADQSMPSEFAYPKVLDLAKPTRPLDFTHSLLCRSRLGRFSVQ